MAEEDQEEGAENLEDGGEGKSGIKRIVIMVLAFLLVAGISVAATLFFLGDSSSDDELPEADQLELEEQVIAPEDGPAVYLALNPEFIVNYSVSGRTRYLKLEISILGRDQFALDSISEHMPLVRNNLLQTLNEQDYKALRTAEGRESLAAALTDTIQEILLDVIGRPGIERVLFRTFVMQ